MNAHPTEAKFRVGDRVTVIARLCTAAGIPSRYADKTGKVERITGYVTENDKRISIGEIGVSGLEASGYVYFRPDELVNHGQ